MYSMWKAEKFWREEEGKNVICRVPPKNTRNNYNFAECRRKTLGKLYLCRVLLTDTRQSSNGQRCA